jgi:hypothetical protein
MEKRYKGKNLYRYFMMRGKTLAVLGALGVLGVAIYSQGAPTIGQLAQSMKSQPTSWTVVVGANANAADVVGASNIIAALETFTVPSTQNVTVSVSSTSASQVPSGVYPFYSSQAPLYLDSNINSVYPVLQVGSGSFQLNQQTYTYEAFVQPASDTIEFENFGSGSNYIPSVGIYAGNNGQLLTLSIYFTPGINVTSLTTNPQQITILGTSYYLSYNNGNMYLVPAANTLTLNVGQSATVNGLTIQLTNVVRDQSGNWYAVLNINGQSYTIQVGTSQVINGVNVYVVNAFASVLTSSSVSAGYATIVVSQGGYQFSLNGGSVYTSSGTAVNGVTVTTNYDSNTQTLSQLTFTFSLTSTQPNGQYALLAGQSYQLPIFSGYELYVAPVQLPTGPLALQLTPSGSTQYTLQYVDAVTGKTVSIPIYGTSQSSSYYIYLFSSSSSGFAGTITNENSEIVPGATTTLATVGSSANFNVQQGQYFAVVDTNLQQTYIFQVQSINTASTPASATLYNYVTGQTLTVYNNTPIVIGSITLVPNITTTAGGQWVVGFNAPSTLYYSTSGLTLYEGYYEYVQVGGINTPSQANNPAQATVTFTDQYSSSKTSEIKLTLSYGNSGFNLGTLTSLGSPVNMIQIGSNTQAYMDNNGVYIVETTSLTSNPTVQLYAPSQPLTINVGLAPSGYTPSATSTSTTQTVSVSVPTPSALIGKVILDTQVTPSMSNLVLVGGPAVNTLTAQAVIQYVSQMNPTLGQELQSYANSQNGYVYGSELAPVLQQLGISFGPGMALIMSSTLYPNTLVIFGWYGNDTTQATQLFANYLVNGVDANVFNNAEVVEVNDQQTVNGYPAATQIQ